MVLFSTSQFQKIIAVLVLIISRHTATAFVFHHHHQSRNNKCCTNTIQKQTMLLLHGATEQQNTNNNKSSNKHIFSSQKERQNEEKRKTERMNEVIIGETSAKINAKDLPLNIEKTEEEYLNSLEGAATIEREVYVWTGRGMEHFRMLQLEEASEAFNKVYILKPKAYIYHSGITFFYLNQLQKAGKYFCQNAMYYESKFDLLATEERIWHIACELKLRSQKNRKELKALKAETKDGLLSPLLSSKLPPIDYTNDNEQQEDGLLFNEKRKVIRLAYDLFSSTIERDIYTLLFTRAKLRMIGLSSTRQQSDPKFYKLQAWYYLGLHYDSIGKGGKIPKSKYCMKRAMQQTYNKSMNGGDIMKCLPLLHMSQRDWFDDEEMMLSDDDDECSIMNNNNNCSLDDVIRKELLLDCHELLVVDLQNALKSKGRVIKGSKGDLIDRLVDLVMEECSTIPATTTSE